jgi:SAM-dependent methyltransferase
MAKLDQHYDDPRLVALYDIENPRGVDTDFYIRLAANINARTILDLGCGTGVLTCELAVGGRQVIGVDPSAAMLAVARRQPNAERVRWIEGDSTVLGRPEADLVMMTGNVAQVFLDDAEWAVSLRNVHAALRLNGHLAFESRNPDDRAWERWNRQASYHQIDSSFGSVESWLELVSVGNNRVSFEHHYVFTDSGEIVVASSELRFRSLTELSHSLIEVGFTVEQVYGDWGSRPFDGTNRVMVFIARRT